MVTDIETGSGHRQRDSGHRQRDRHWSQTERQTVVTDRQTVVTDRQTIAEGFLLHGKYLFLSVKNAEQAIPSKLIVISVQVCGLVSVWLLCFVL